MEEVEHRMISTESRLVSFLKCFCAALVIVPGHPEHGEWARPLHARVDLDLYFPRFIVPYLY
jgi:hypothetical protein